MNVSWILHRDFLEGNKKGHRFTLAVALYILTLRLTIPIPLKYPTLVPSRWRVSQKQEKPPQTRGLLS